MCTWGELIAKHPEIPASKLHWWLSDRLNAPLTGLPLARSAPPELAAAFEAAAARLAAGEPVQYICGRAPFRDFELKVGPEVLIPRPETEQLVQHVLGESLPADSRVLDVGTGSGCIAIALKRARPDWRVAAREISPAALALAEQNAKQLGLQIHFTQGDLLRGLPPASVDLLIANLPYIGLKERNDLPAEVRDFEPATALFGGEDGSELVCRLLREAVEVMAPQGRIWLEIGETQSTTYQAEARRLGWSLRLFPDLAGRSRFLRLWREARRADFPAAI